jgi:cobalt-zinc-cadmium resistance protein CzcA
LIQFSIRNAIWVMLFVMTWIAVGIWSYQKLPIDAVPDITNTQVQINTQANGYTALEVEQRITYPIETAMAGIPDSRANPFDFSLWLIASNHYF